MALAPPPIQAASGDFIWVDWYNQLSAYLTRSSSIPWDVINKAGSKLSDLATRTHAMLQSVQGGNATEQYHLTNAQWTALPTTYTGTGASVLQTSPTLITPALGTPSSGVATNLTGTATGLTAGTVVANATIPTPNITGVTNASNATAGSIGEYTESVVTGVAITTGVPTNVTSISLTAGDWEVQGNILTNTAGSTTTQYCIAGINTISATTPTRPKYGESGAAAAGFFIGTDAPITRINISSTTTVYLVAQVGYSVSTLTIDGWIRARRVR